MNGLEFYVRLFGQWQRKLRFDLAWLPDAKRFYDGELKGARKSSGLWYSACCPFHEDQHASFAFNSENGRWRCHAGCGSGSMIDFVMKRYGLGFRQACERLGLRKVPYE
jgi:hypothetical protein